MKVRVVGGIALAAVWLGTPALAQHLCDSRTCSHEHFDLLPPFLEPETGCGKATRMRGLWMAQMEHGVPTGPSMPDLRGPGAGSGNTDVLNYDLDIEVVPSTEEVFGTNTMTIKSLVAGLGSFQFALRNNYAISSCTVTDSIGSYAAVPTGPASGSYLRTVTFSRPIPLDEVFTITVVYGGEAVSRGFGSIEFRTVPGTATPVITSLSEPYFAATWWPCKDGDFGAPGDNSDKATIQLGITAPSNLRSVSNGLLVGTDVLSGNRTRYRWATAYPTATYLVCFATTEYFTWTQMYQYGPGQQMPVEFNLYTSSNTAGNRAAWEKCLLMFEAFRPIFGLYPFIDEKYGIYQFPFSGGMEHQTNTGQGTFSESITAHELAHQWWGDTVTCETWHDIWLNEGFATYSEALWEERKPGSTGLPALHAAMASRRPSSVNGTVYCPTTTDFNRIFSSTYSYRKAAWVLHMLRRAVGDAAFFDILTAHRAAHEGTAATTAEFIAVASAAAGQDLSWFFTPWIYSPGAPEYQFGWENASIGGDNYLRLHVRQLQSGPYPIYDMPLDVRVDFAGGGSQTFVVRSDAGIDHFLIPLPSPAAAVVLDEFDWVLNTGKAAVTYVAGPPKVAATTPAPGEVLASAASPSAVEVVFSDEVNLSAANFSVLRGGDTVPFSLAYSAAARTATLDFGSPLAAGDYTVMISDTITAVGGTTPPLDGEIADPFSPASLPSGDGEAGGMAMIGFTVESGVGTCPADFDGDGQPTIGDIFAMMAAWFTQPPPPSPADANGNGTYEVADIFAFLAIWFAGCP